MEGMLRGGRLLFSAAYSKTFCDIRKGWFKKVEWEDLRLPRMVEGLLRRRIEEAFLIKFINKPNV